MRANFGLMWTSYVALGDSFTEGVGDMRPDGTLRGWADLVAGALAAQQPGLQYANLAVRGKLIRQIVEEQVPRAVELHPGLITLFGGVNDLLRPRVDVSYVAGLFDRAARELRAGGSDVLVFRGGGASRAAGQDGRGRMGGRIAAFNAAILRTADRYGCIVADMAAPDVFRHPAMWSADRLHLSSLGHERIAAVVCETLGVPFPVLADWRVPLDPADPTPWLAARGSDVRWAGTYLAPWVLRRLQGRSSGDGRAPKRPELAPVVPPA